MDTSCHHQAQRDGSFGRLQKIKKALSAVVLCTKARILLLHKLCCDTKCRLSLIREVMRREEAPIRQLTSGHTRSTAQHTTPH